MSSMLFLYIFFVKNKFYDKHLGFYMGFHVQQSVLDERELIEFRDGWPH